MKPTYVLACASLLIAHSALAADMTCGGKVNQAALAKVTNFVPKSVSSDEELLAYLQAAQNLCGGDSTSYWAEAVQDCKNNYSPMGATPTKGCYDPAVQLYNLRP